MILAIGNAFELGTCQPVNLREHNGFTRELQ